MHYLNNSNNRRDLESVSRNFSMLLPLLGLGLSAFLGSKSKDAAEAMKRTDPKKYNAILNEALPSWRDLRKLHPDWSDSKIFDELNTYDSIREAGYSKELKPNAGLLSRAADNVGLGISSLLRFGKKWTIDNANSIPDAFKRGRTWEGIGRSALTAAEIGIPLYMIWKGLNKDEYKKPKPIPAAAYYPSPFIGQYPPAGMPPRPYPIPYRFSRHAPRFQHREFILPFQPLKFQARQYSWRRLAYE